MNRNKLLEFFDATEYKYNIHVVGCGAIGSHVCEELARLGFPTVHIYDFDTVAPHNITNQMFKDEDIDKPKVEACAKMMKAINPGMKIYAHPKGLQEPYALTGVIIMCVDDIELRKKIVEANSYNPYTAVILDFRMRLTDAQHYLASMQDKFERETLLATMDFTHEEAKEATPTSACGVELSVVYTVKQITALGMANLVKWLQKSDYKTMIVADMNLFTVDAFKAKPRKTEEDALTKLVNTMTTA